MGAEMGTTGWNGDVFTLDEEAMLAVCPYIALNLPAAEIAAVPEASAHTSIKQRVDHVQAQGGTDDLATVDLVKTR
jgi:hypothetical protein